MPSAALHTADALMTNVDSALRTVGFDLPSVIRNIDFKTVGLITGSIIFGLLIFDLLSQWLGSFNKGGGDYSSYSSYGRSLAVGAAKVWDQKNEIGLLEGVRGGRSLDSVTKVLDSISDAVLKWDKEEPTGNGTKKELLKSMPRKSKVLS